MWAGGQRGGAASGHTLQTDKTATRSPPGGICRRGVARIHNSRGAGRRTHQASSPRSTRAAVVAQAGARTPELRLAAAQRVSVIAIKARADDRIPRRGAIFGGGALGRVWVVRSIVRRAQRTWPRWRRLRPAGRGPTEQSEIEARGWGLWRGRRRRCYWCLPLMKLWCCTCIEGLTSCPMPERAVRALRKTNSLRGSS